jgi:hypothetical protein
MLESNHQDRIDYKILADCYNDYEQGQAWTLYLLDNMDCPFEAIYTGQSKLSIALQQEITVLALINSIHDSEEEFECFFAKVEVEVGDTLYEVPLSDLNILSADLRTQQAVADWQYFSN